MTKIDNAYIISYKSPRWSDKEWAKRYENHKTQVEFWKALGFNIYVFAQFYDEIEKLEGVTYLPWNGERHLPGEARNECLKHFFETNNDFCLLMDDDMTLYETTEEKNYGDSVDTIRILRSIPVEKLKDVGIFTFQVARFDLYGKFFRETSDYKDNLVFERRPHLAGSLLFIKNFNKHYGEKHFYPLNWCDDNGEVIHGEDAYYSLDLQRKGHNSFKLQNAVIKDWGMTLSTHLNDDTKAEITAKFIAVKHLLVNRIPELSYTDQGDGNIRIKWSEFAAKYNPHRTLLIPKDGIDRSLSEFFS